MRNLIVTGLLFVLSGLPGCKSVISDHLIGVPLEAEQAQVYEGVWKAGESVLHIKHLESGDLLVAGLEWDDDRFKLNQFHVVVTSHHGSRFVHKIVDESDELDLGPAGNTAGEGAGANELYLLMGMLSSPDDDSIVLHGPTFERFKQALDAGEITGRVDDDGNELHIRGEKASLDALVDPERLHELFELLQPGVMTRVGELD